MGFKVTTWRCLGRRKIHLRKMPITYRATMITTSRARLIDNRASMIAIELIRTTLRNFCVNIIKTIHQVTSECRLNRACVLFFLIRCPRNNSHANLMVYIYFNYWSHPLKNKGFFFTSRRRIRDVCTHPCDNDQDQLLRTELRETRSRLYFILNGRYYRHYGRYARIMKSQ